jgi:hypothetical protein
MPLIITALLCIPACTWSSVRTGDHIRAVADKRCRQTGTEPDMRKALTNDQHDGHPG